MTVYTVKYGQNVVVNLTYGWAWVEVVLLIYYLEAEIAFFHRIVYVSTLDYAEICPCNLLPNCCLDRV